jgi:hypothetical protein
MIVIDLSSAVTNQVKAVLFLLIVWLVRSLDGSVWSIVSRASECVPRRILLRGMSGIGDRSAVRFSGVRPGFLEVKYLISKRLAREWTRQ